MATKVKKSEIRELVKIAREANLKGLDFLDKFTVEEIQQYYNGIGPEFLNPRVRKAVSDFLHIYKPAAVIHDLRNEFSDGTRQGFSYANKEFLINCQKLSDYTYKDDAKRRRRANGASLVLYGFVSAEKFGWRAWLEAKERHEARTASSNSAGETKKELK